MIITDAIKMEWLFEVKITFCWFHISTLSDMYDIDNIPIAEDKSCEALMQFFC